MYTHTHTHIHTYIYSTYKYSQYYQVMLLPAVHENSGCSCPHQILAYCILFTLARPLVPV